MPCALHCSQRAKPDAYHNNSCLLLMNNSLPEASRREIKSAACGHLEGRVRFANLNM